MKPTIDYSLVSIPKTLLTHIEGMWSTTLCGLNRQHHTYASTSDIEECTCVECFKCMDTDTLTKAGQEIYDELKQVFTKAGLLL